MTALMVAFIAGCAGRGAVAQTGVIARGAQTSKVEARLDLPESPGAVSSSAATLAEAGMDGGRPGQGQATMAGHTDKYILPQQQVPALSVKDKYLLGLRDAVSPFSALGWLSSAGYEQLTNGSPNYGTDRGAFGQRLGASVIRDFSEGVLSDSVAASLLHEDPRYYQMGRGHSIVKRAVYAGTRAIITKTDGGRTTPNLALLSGNLAGSILTNAYYPKINTGVTQTAETFGTSVGGSAVGFLVNEFLDDALSIVHIGNRR